MSELDRTDQLDLAEIMYEARDVPDSETWVWIRDRLADFCTQRNLGFKRQRFIDSCNDGIVTKTTIPKAPGYEEDW